MPNKILILLATYNGAPHLPAQLDSLLSQTRSQWRLLVHDDGSTDETLTILKQYRDRYPDRITLLEDGIVCGGASANFAHLLSKADAEYLMFCDQDDVWHPDKIEKTLQTMKEMEAKYPGEPVLVHTDLEVTDEKLRVLDESFWHYGYIDPHRDSFNRLLMQNVVTGCTVMINRKLASLALPIPEDAVMHDWWIGLVASRFGKIGIVEEATVKYRQHGGNSIGAKGYNALSALLKFYKAFTGNELYLKHLRMNIGQAEAFLRRYREELDEKSVAMLKAFIDIESAPFWQRRWILLKYGLLKQGILRNLGLFLKI